MGIAPVDTFGPHTTHTMTKRLLSFAAIAAFFVPAASAQQLVEPKLQSPFRKGTFTIGAQLGVADFAAASGHNGKSVLEYQLFLSPSVGYFVTDNLLLSANLLGGFAGNTMRNSYSAQSAGVGLSARYYFGTATTRKGEVRRFRFYAEAGANYARGWSRIDRNDSLTERYAGYHADVRGGVGFNYLISDNVAFESGLTYNRMIGGKDPVRSNGQVQLELGLRVFLNRKRP